MRFVVASVVGSSITLALLWGCTVTEYPNPPANPNGATSSSSSGSSLPDPSSEVDEPDQGTSSSGGSKDGGGGKDVSTTPTLPNGPTTGIDPNKKVGSLSSADKKLFCDWQAGINGGYGRSAKCDGGLTLSNPKTQAACVADMPPATCQGTIAEFETCMKLDAQDPCSMALFKAPECAAVRTCAGL